MSAYVFFILVPILLGLWAQMRVQEAYRKWTRVPTRRQITGAQAARAVLDNAGLQSVKIECVDGVLTDHYDPIHRCLALSRANYLGTSLAAVGVAAHEAGHALQHRDAYPALKWRMSLVPITGFASKLFYILIFLALFTPFAMKVAVAMAAVFIILTVFQLVTLPVEFNASARAKKALAAQGLVAPDEMPAVSDMLSAAAWTYVAAFVSSLAGLFYWISRSVSR